MRPGTPTIPALERTLGEERKMAQAVHDLIEPTTRRFIKLSEEGRKADR
jgi:ferritin-like metal-binding protein YciE